MFNKIVIEESPSGGIVVANGHIIIKVLKTMVHVNVTQDNLL